MRLLLIKIAVGYKSNATCLQINSLGETLLINNAVQLHENKSYRYSAGVVDFRNGLDDCTVTAFKRKLSVFKYQVS